VTADVGQLLAELDTQLRDQALRFSPLGTVVERDGPVVRVHYGTHGLVEFPNVSDDDIDALIRRQQAAFADRGEPVEWKVFGHDPPGVAARLLDAGFTPGWQRPILIGAIDDIAESVDVRRLLPPGQRIRWLGYREHAFLAQIRTLAERSGPHRKPLDELQADGRFHGWQQVLLLLEVDGRARGAGWAELVTGTQFISIGGLTVDHPGFLAGWAAWAGHRRRDLSSREGRDWRYFVAEADGDLRAMLMRLGFQQVSTVQSYHWAPPGTPMQMRPVRLVFDDPQGDAVWERFTSQWNFSPHSQAYPGVVEPTASVTWHLEAIHGNDALIGELERIVRRGLRASTRSGERVYCLNPFTQGYHFDARLAGGFGEPSVPCRAFPHHGDHSLYTTEDLRLGTFGDPSECSLCVFGEDLLAVVKHDLTALLGTVLRRGGQNVENTWTFGPGR
jgi:hypothetical protein